MKVVNDLNDLLSVLTAQIFNDILVYKMGQYDPNDESWDAIGFDDLDQVEFIMEIEKRCDCHIYDEFADRMYREISPKMIYKLLMRDQNLNTLGI